MAGIDFNQSRIKQVATVLLALSMKPGGFTRKDLAEEFTSKSALCYSRRKASYDIRKFRGKELVNKINGSNRYVITEKGVKTIAAILCILTKEIPAILTIIKNPWAEQKKEKLSQMDEHLFATRNT